MSKQNDRLTSKDFEPWNPIHEALTWTDLDKETCGILDMNTLHILHINSHYEAVSAILEMLESKK